jgi:drug/metabolite transporter (DMT)-like permease
MRFSIACRFEGRDMGLMGQEQAKENLVPGQAPLRFGLTALILGNLCLSFGPLLVRLSDTGPVASAFWRITLAIPVLLLIARQVGDPVRMPRGRAFWLFLISGLLFAVDLAAWHLGIPLTKMANTNLLGNSTSFLLPLWAFATARAWPTRMQGAALLLAGLGAALLLGRSFELSPQHLMGDLLCMLAGAFYTGYLIIMGRMREGMGQWPTLALSTVMSALPLLIMALLLGEQIVPQDWTPLILLALGSQVVGQGFMIYAIGRVAPLLFGITLLVQPMVSAAVGWIKYAEALAPADWMGAALIGLALVLVRQPAKAPA